MEKEKILLLVKDIHLYFYALLEACDVYSVYSGGLQMADSALEKWKEHNVFSDADFGEWKNHLSEYKLIVMMDYGYETYLSEYIKTFTDARTVLFLWNAVNHENIDLLERVKQSESIDDIYTFDPFDAYEHSLKHNTTFYSSKILCQNLEKKYDVFFGGKDKNRSKLILETKHYMEALGLNFLLHCPEVPESISDEYVTYPEYLKMTAESRSLLEILKTGQTGISLRAMESLFFGKKLITQNSVIKYYRFYHPENIFILGEDNLSGLKGFIEKPYVDIEEEIVRYFDFPQWLARFEKDDLSDIEQYAFYKDDMRLKLAN